MEIEVVTQQSQIAVAIKKTSVSMDQLKDLFDEVCTKLLEYLAQQGGQMAGAPYCMYSGGNEDYSQFDIEFGIPVTEPVPETGEIFMSRTCEGKAVSTTHKGAYKDIDSAYMALMDYVKENSLELTGVYYDYYISNPEETPESELLTQIFFPVK